MNSLTETWHRTDFAFGSEGHYVYFRTDPTFVGFGQNKLEITVVAKRAAPDKATEMTLSYESMQGYRRADGGFSVPSGEGWHEHTWKVEDANFVGAWVNTSPRILGRDECYSSAEGQVTLAPPSIRTEYGSKTSRTDH